MTVMTVKTIPNELNKRIKHFSALSVRSLNFETKPSHNPLESSETCFPKKNYF